MSCITWTPAAVASEGRPWRGCLWRAVEAQHRVSTLRLVDTLDEQAQLESLLETSKPALPPVAAPRHYLLLTPFRYPSPHPGGSRFRSATDPGVFYGADERRTACAELGYWRWRFLDDCPALERLDSLPHTLFQAEAVADALDLTAAPLARDAVQWQASRDYAACQAIGQAAREAGLRLIRYQSVRDPLGGMCAAVLTPDAFTARTLVEQTWRLAVTRTHVQWQRESVLHDERFEFTVDWR